MPLGSGLRVKDIRAGLQSVGDNYRRNSEGFEKSLLTEVLPRVSRTYKVSNKPAESAIGKDDFLLKQNRDFTAWLKSRNIRHTYEETEGAHTWLVWRRYLTTFLNAVNW